MAGWFNNIFGTAGRDLLLGSPQGDTLNGLAGDDAIVAGAGDDYILGNGREGAFGDELAGPGRNLIFGGAGNDTAIAGYQADIVFGGAGEDVIHGSGSYAGGGGGGVAAARGDAGDLLIGGAGNDLINGDGGNDTLLGGADDDTLIGSWGRDELVGGPGSDLFTFAFIPGGLFEAGTGSDALTRDRIRDFAQGSDRIDLQGYDQWRDPGIAPVFIGSDEFDLDDRRLQVRSETEGSVTVVQFRVTVPAGPGPQIYELELNGCQTLTAQDFVL